jgi:hypothetical protein
MSLICILNCMLPLSFKSIGCIILLLQFCF